MNTIKSFENELKNGFKLSNSYEIFNTSKSDLKITIKNGGFFISNSKNKLITFFVNEDKNFNLKKCYIKIMDRNENRFLKFKSFLQNNNFKEIATFNFMEMKNSVEICDHDSAIIYPKTNLKDEIFSFLIEFFNTDYELYFNADDIGEKIKKQEVLIDFLDDKIAGVLVFTKTYPYITIDAIATKKNIRKIGGGRLLLNKLCSDNKNFKLIKLFVRSKNEKAIKFYTEFGFIKKERIIKFYTN